MCLLLGAPASSGLTCSVHLSQQACLCAAETSLSGWTPLWVSPCDSKAVPVRRTWRSLLPAQIQHQSSETYCFLCASPWGPYELLRNLKSAPPGQPAAPPGFPVSGTTVYLSAQPEAGRHPYPCQCFHFPAAAASGPSMPPGLRTGPGAPALPDPGPWPHGCHSELRNADVPLFPAAPG